MWRMAGDPALKEFRSEARKPSETIGVTQATCPESLELSDGDSDGTEGVSEEHSGEESGPVDKKS